MRLLLLCCDESTTTMHTAQHSTKHCRGNALRSCFWKWTIPRQPCQKLPPSQRTERKPVVFLPRTHSLSVRRSSKWLMSRSDRRSFLPFMAARRLDFTGRLLSHWRTLTTTLLLVTTETKRNEPRTQQTRRLTPSILQCTRSDWPCSPAEQSLLYSWPVPVCYGVAVIQCFSAMRNCWEESQQLVVVVVEPHQPQPQPQPSKALFGTQHQMAPPLLKSNDYCMLENCMKRSQRRPGWWRRQRVWIRTGKGMRMEQLM